MYSNFGTIVNTTINADGHSIRFHSNSMSPFYNCNTFMNFRPCIWGYGFPTCGYNSMKFGLGVGLGMAAANIVTGVANRIFNA